jgi:hypothetical protein
MMTVIISLCLFIRIVIACIFVVSSRMDMTMMIPNLYSPKRENAISMENGTGTSISSRILVAIISASGRSVNTFKTIHDDAEERTFTQSLWHELCN